MLLRLLNAMLLDKIVFIGLIKQLKTTFIGTKKHIDILNITNFYNKTFPVT